MSNKANTTTNLRGPQVYQIKIKGHLGSQWSDWFDGLTITPDEEGNTLLTGSVIDDAALYGLLKKVRDLGMPLISFHQIGSEFEDRLRGQTIKKKLRRNGMTNSMSSEAIIQNHDKGEKTMATTEKMNPNKVARIAGLLYIPPWILSLVAFFLRQELIVPGDAAATANNIIASKSVFTLSIVMDLIAQVVFIFLVLVLYQLFKYVNQKHAVVMAVLFLVSVPLAMLNTLNLFAAQLLSNNAVQLQELVPFFLELNEIGIHIAYIFWGLWLFPFGYLAFKSGFIPKILGIYLMISCFGYLIDFVTYFFFPDVGIAVNMFTGWAELFICIWLLIKGVDVEVWHNRALEAG